MAEEPPEKPSNQEIQNLDIFLTEFTEKDKQIQELQKSLSEEKTARKQERFYGIVCFVILLDSLLFPPMKSWGGPLSILILELILLVPLARITNVEEVEKLIDQIFYIFSSKK
jgi:hypothetical protein